MNDTQPRQQFIGSKLKIEWANYHIKGLNGVFERFLETDFCKIHVQPDPHTGSPVLKLDSISDLPFNIPLGLGDAVHNLRTALDYVTTHFVGKDNHRVSFPVSTTRDKLVATSSFTAIQKAVPDLAQYILDVIQPYQGGNFKVWEVTQLDNFDKHKLLIPVVSLQTIPGIHAKDENGVTFTDLTASVGGGGVLRIVDGLNLKIISHGKPTATIRFPKGALFENEPIIPTMLQLLQSVAKAVESLEEFCFGAPPNRQA